MLRLVIALLLAAPLPALAQCVWNERNSDLGCVAVAPQPISTTRIAPSPGVKELPEIATNGYGYAVSWGDRSRGFSAAELDRDGKLINVPVVFPNLCRSDRHLQGERPSLAPTGSGYLQYGSLCDTREPQARLLPDSAVAAFPSGSANEALRVSIADAIPTWSSAVSLLQAQLGAVALIAARDGRSEGRRVAPGALPASMRIASDGYRFLAVGPGFYNFQWNLINADATTKWPTPEVLLDFSQPDRPAGYVPLTHSLSWSGTEYTLIINDTNRSQEYQSPRSRLLLVTIDADGNVKGTPRYIHEGPAIINTRQLPLGGGRTLVTWDSYPNGHPTYSAAVATEAIILGCGNDSRVVRLGPPGSAFGTNGRTIVRARVTTVPNAGEDAYAVAKTAIPISALACGVTDVAWEPETIISVGFPSQEVAAGASAAEETAVLWREREGATPSRIRGTTVSNATGRRIDPLVAPAPEAQQWAPAVASDGRDFVAVWYEGADPAVVKSARLVRGTHTPPAAAAALLGRAMVKNVREVLQPSAEEVPSAPAIIWNGTNYLTSWTGEDGQLRVARLGRDGKQIDDTPSLVAAPLEFRRGDLERQLSPRMATNGDVTLLVWWEQSERQCSNCQGRPYRSVRAARLDRDGRVMDPVPLMLGDDITWARMPAVTWNGGSFLVFWSYSSDFANYQLAATRIATHGGVIGARLITGAATTDYVTLQPFTVNGITHVSWAGSADYVRVDEHLRLRAPRTSPFDASYLPIVMRNNRVLFSQVRQLLPFDAQRPDSTGPLVYATVYAVGAESALPPPPTPPRRRSTR